MSAPATAAARPLPGGGATARRASRFRGSLPAVLGLVSFFALWQGMVMVTNTPAFVLPTPTLVAKRLWEELPDYAYELSYTLAAAGIGLAIGRTIRLVGAVPLPNRPILERRLFPVAGVRKLVPFIAIPPL